VFGRNFGGFGYTIGMLGGVLTMTFCIVQATSVFINAAGSAMVFVGGACVCACGRRPQDCNG
jgi:hypothetical protein